MNYARDDYGKSLIFNVIINIQKNMGHGFLGRKRGGGEGDARDRKKIRRDSECEQMFCTMQDFILHENHPCSQR